LWYDPFQDIPLDNLDGEDSPLAEQFGGLTSYGNAGNGKLKKLKDIRAAVNVEKILKQTSQFPIDQLVEESVVDRSRYIASPYPEVPSYYDKQTRLDQIYYIPLYALSQEDPLDVFKQYHDLDGGILVPGDDVRVTVTLKANKA